MPFSPDFQAFEVKILEIVERIVLRHVHRLVMAVSTNGATAATIRMWSSAEISSAVTKCGRQSPRRRQRAGTAATHGPRPSYFSMRAVGHALLALVGPGERRLDAVGRVVGEREQIVPVGAIESRWLLRMPCWRDLGAEVPRAGARRNCGARDSAPRRTAGTRPSPSRVATEAAYASIAHALGDRCAHARAGVGVVAQAEHDERIAQAR